MVVLGFGWPEVATRLIELLTPDPAGAPAAPARLWIVEPDPMRALDGLASASLDDGAFGERVVWLLGEGAIERLAADLEARIETALPGRVVMSEEGLDAGAIERIVAHATNRQSELLARARTSAEAAYAGRGTDFWRRRFERALAGEDRPLRVLLPSSRHTTFIRHTVEDLAEGLRANGVATRIVIEPDGGARLSPLAMARAVAAFEPDLVLSVNHPRARLGNMVPKGLPTLCWIQDGMAHLFDGASGSAQTELDFLAGHTFERLFAEFGYPRRQAMRTCVGVSTRKFRIAPVGEDDAERFACEAAYVGNQSEPVEAMHTRLAATLAPNDAARRAMDALRERVLGIVATPMEGVIHRRLDGAVRESLRDALGAEPDARLFAVLLSQYALPLADRAYRHEALAWAAAIARERGWRFRLYGRGWERHPTLGGFARGPISHGESLRACYATARAHLHAAILSPVHQRPVECALSGGLPLVRVNIDEVHSVRYWLTSRVAAQAGPDVRDPATGEPCWDMSDHPLLMELACALGRLGLPIPERKGLAGWAERALRERGPMLPEDLAHWIYGGMGEATFTDRAGLESLLVRAVERPRWRENLSSLMRRRMAERLSVDRLVRDALGFMIDRWGGAPSSAARERVWRPAQRSSD